MVIKLKKFKRFLSSFLASSLMLGMVSNATEITINNKISNEEVEIINQYVEGEKMLPEQIEARKNKAEELNLLEWVDENYFLVDAFYDGKSDAELEELGVSILVNTITNKELSEWANNLKNGISPLEVNSYETITFSWYTVGKFEVDGRMAFCADHDATTPWEVGRETGEATPSTNENLRKVLYYGFGGPGQIEDFSTYYGTIDMDKNSGWVATTLGASQAYKGNGSGLGKVFLDKVKDLPSPPSGFKVYIVPTNGGRTQDLTYWEYSPKGQLQIEKSSANPTITNNNNCYSLAGAVYGVYTNSNATNQVATLTTGSDGKSQVIELDEGQYYIKEITPPKGFALDNTIYPITVNSGNLAVGRYSDRPQTDPIGILIRKVDADTGNAVPVGNGSLANAEFTVKFYAGNYDDGVNPADLGIVPTKTWVMKTNENGYVRFEDSYKVSGDSFWYTSFGIPTLPAGTLTIQESKAPIGYKLNSEIFIRKITTSGTAEIIDTYNEPIVKEEVIKGRIKVTKVDEETGEKLQGAEFELVNKATGEVVETLVTGADGTATSGLHPFAEYILRETKAPDKFVLNGQEHFITISEDLVTIEVTHQNRIIKGRIEINKEDSEIAGLKLEGVKFGIFDENNKIVEELTTDENGYAISGWLNYGDYKLKEISSANGYLPTNQEWDIQIREDGKTYTYNIKNEIIKGRIQVIKVDEETGEKLQGAEFEIVNKATGQVVEKLVTGVDGSAISGLHRFGEYIVREIKAPDKYTLNGKEYFITINQNLQTIKVTHQNRIIKGRIEINKEDSEIAGLKLEGVKFGIFDENESLVEELITNENGYAISGWLNYGDYTVRELETKDGYELNNQEWKVEIRADQKTYTYNITNDVIKGSIQIVKINSTNAEKPVEGATFNIVAEDVFGIEAGTIVDTVTTDENGFAFTKELRHGKYFVQEISVGNDYWLNTNKYPITISEADKVEVVHIKNEPVEMKLRVVKKDSETKEAINGTKFKVVNKETGEDVEFTEFFGIIPYKKVVFTTDKNGEIVFPQKLSAGDYQLVETEPSEGYNAIEPIDFTIDRNTNYEDITLLGKVTTIEVENTRIKGDVELLKLDADSKEPMANVEFLVECLDGFDKGNTWTFFTSEDGIIKLEQFNYGKYKITEVKTLEGYILNTKPIEFEITENGQKIKLEMTNERIKGDVELLKLDADSKEPMANVEFLVECLDGFDKGKTWTVFTDENGKIKLEKFNYGKYQITEVKTIEGYVLNTTPIEFEITENGQKIELEMTNDRIKGDMKLLKLDSKTGEPLANVRFKINGITGFNEGKEFKLYSNDYGIVELRDLEYGSYRIDEIETANGGYVLNTTPIYFEIRENGETVELEMTNDRIVGNMELLKVDADTKKPMAFVKFKVTAVDTFEIDQEYILESDNEGLIRLENLEAGVYRIDEIETLEGYILNTEPIFFTIQNNGETVQLEMENTIKKGNVELLKVDEDTNRPLQGVTFELCKGDEVVGEYVTDENGKIVVENLPWGNYYFVEIATDDNYILDQDKFYDFFIEEDGQVIEITATNKVKEGEVDFSKTDVSTGELIEGATIHIKGQDEQNSHIDFEFVSTNEETRFKLPVGRYEFVETVAPNGYVLNEEIGYFEILENEVIKAELKNKRIEGILEFEKTDVSTGEVIEGAQIKIECVEGFNKGQVIEFVSSAEGNKFELEYGKYIISEIIPPDGFELTTETSTFEITEDGQIVKAELKNKRVQVPVLPQTGGTDTVIVISLALVVTLAGAMMFRKKKAN